MQPRTRTPIPSRVAAVAVALLLAACGASPAPGTTPGTSGAAMLQRATGASPQQGAATAGAGPTQQPGGGGSPHETGASAPVRLRTLSNRADLISDGDAMVELVLPKPDFYTALRVTLNGRDVKDRFVGRGDGATFVAVLDGLKVGENRIVATVGMASHGGQLVVTNHPRGGPVLLSAQTTPWVCATPTGSPATADKPATNPSGLSTAAYDAQCNIATEYRLFYRTKETACSHGLPDPVPVPVPDPSKPPPAPNCFQPYDATVSPDLVATTTTSEGVTVPYVVRVERGTMNRGIYDIAVLFHPGQPWTALDPQPQWNRKVVYSFGASTGQPRLQFRSEQNWADDAALSRGFMVVDNSLTDSLYDSNRILVAETLMMMKEHIIDAYGEVRFVMGNGCSGGSIQQNTVASTFPGLLDGIQPSCNYPDSITTGLEVADCVLLVNFYAGPAWQGLTTGLTQAEINAKKTAINGHLDWVGCQSWNNSFGFNNEPGNYQRTLITNQLTGAITPEVDKSGNPVYRNNCLLPASMVYDPASNPTGTRCGDADLAAAVWGTTTGIAPGSRRALQTYDNVGVQYGLGALLAGAITPDEFLTLNEKIGGTDPDSNLVPTRSVADADALPIAYRAGIVSSGENLGQLPIIDSRGWDEQGIHYIWRTYAERARIDAANAGDHGNQVIWRYGTGLLPATAAQVAAVTVRSLDTMDEWLTNLVATAPKAWVNAERTQEQVVAAKPAGAFDLCYLTGDASFSTPVTDMAVCDADARLQKHGSPRLVGGGSLAENVLKCRLRQPALADYQGRLTQAQFARLQAIFPDGVCDWTEPGVGQQPAVSPLTFAAGPGGVPLGAPPASTELPPGRP